MRYSPFAHLHVHSDYSLLAATMTVSEMLDAAVEMRMPAIALTDYGNLFGAIEFYSQAMRRGVKPILGCEMYVCEDIGKRVSEGPRAPRYGQVVLLARNNEGWKNLMKLSSIGYLEGFYYKPRIDRRILAEHAQGLIALSSGWNGEIEQALQRHDREAARAIAAEYKAMFGEHCFFIELQRDLRLEQDELNQELIALAHELDIPLVATSNAHFLKRDDFGSFEVMLALQHGRTVKDGVSHHFTAECCLKSYEEMAELFADVPEAVENTMHIANRCNVDLTFGRYQLPDFRPPDGMDLKEHLRAEARAGLDERWPAIVAGRPQADRAEYDRRLEFELDVIEKMGFPGYFLIVSDFIRWAKARGIPVGPGRGSGAGSLVAYSLKITDLDPLRYGLLFERFLNPERVSMPDFDIDFCMSRREEVIRYVTEKYGEDKVAQIITFGSMKAKAVVRDVGRALGVELAKVNTIAKLIPNDLKMTLEKALVDEPRLEEMVDKDADVARIFDLAFRLEGRHRNAGKHAAGVIIGRDPLVETAPLFKVPGEEGKVVQWDMGNAEKVGLIKFDFLGLKTLTVIDMASRFVREASEPDFDIARIPLDDPETFKLLQRGQTGAVFQVESQGMRELLVRLRPDCFEDLIALVALYRPGPLESGMVDTYIECKHGRQEIRYALPQLEPILKETNGVILYQEQVMQIARELAGYTLGQADMLRRAMGKKKPEEMMRQREIFMEGAAKKRIPADKAEQIFDLMEKFAGYGFNKSHSAAYALIAWQTAWLKAHHPRAFMAATLSCDMGNSDKVAALVSDCRQMGIEVLPPHVNDSDWGFRPEGEAIRFGLGAIKGVGEAAIRALVAEREANGRFGSFEDMVLRAPDRALNKRILEALIKAGALDGLIPERRAAFEGLATAMDKLARRRKEFAARQNALFGAMAPAEGEEGLFASVPPWSASECLQGEREVLGFYLSGHPLANALAHLDGLGNANLGDLAGLEDGAEVVIPATVVNVRPYHGRGGTMAFVRIEDMHGQADLVVFARLFGEVAELLQSDRPLLVAARVDRAKDEPALIADAVRAIDEALPDLVEVIEITAQAVSWDEMTLARLKTMTGEEGRAALRFRVRLADGSVARLESARRATWSDEMRAWLAARFGEDAVRLRCAPWRPPRQARKGRRQAAGRAARNEG